MSENKCDAMGIEHAWRDKQEMWGFEFVTKNECANCGLIRTKHHEFKEWWSYSDGRPSEPIHNMKPV